MQDSKEKWFQDRGGIGIDNYLKALWAYRTTVRTATGCTPYNSLFGSEVVLLGEHHLLALALDHFDKTEEINVIPIFKVKEEID